MGFRKLIRPTPEFTVPPPYNPVSGDHNNLEVYGDFPYCAMMQVACEDKYENHVICRGFDPRMRRFVDYAENNADKPGISVAKPFGCRVTDGGAKRYRIGEIFPAVLPTQGSADFDPNYVPPSPVDVKWRLGQNSGVAANDAYGGHVKCLKDEIVLLKDHNNKVINWIFINTETKLFKFQCLEKISGKKYRACVRQMSDYWPHEADIHDPQEIFDNLRRGTKGLVLFQEGKYYIIQAKCNPEKVDNCECTTQGGEDCECQP